MNIYSQKKQTGAALVEFAIGFPFFLFLTFVTIDLSLMLIKKTQLDFALEETLNTFAIDDICDYSGITPSEQFEADLKVNLRKFLLYEGSIEEGHYNSPSSPTITLSHCEDDTTPYSDIFDESPVYIRTELTFNLGCTVCKLIPGIGNSLAMYERNYFQAINYYQPGQSGVENCQINKLEECNEE